MVVMFFPLVRVLRYSDIREPNTKIYADWRLRYRHGGAATQEDAQCGVIRETAARLRLMFFLLVRYMYKVCHTKENPHRAQLEANKSAHQAVTWTKYPWMAGVIKRVRMKPDAFDTYPMQISKDASSSVHEAFAQGCQAMVGSISGQRPALVSRESPALEKLLCNNFRHDHSQ